MLAAGGDPARVVFSGVGKTRAEMRARSRSACAASTSRARASSSCCREVASRAGAARAGQPARQPRRRRRHASLHLDRPEGQQVRHRPRGGAAPRTARAARAARARGGRHRLPHRLADHRGRALPRRARPPARPGRGVEADGIAARAPRRRRRPGHHLHRRDAAAMPARWSRACSSASTRAATAIAKLMFEPGPLAGRQRRRAAHRGALPEARRASKNFCIVDAAMNDLMRPAMYDAWMRIVECAPRSDGAAVDLGRRRAGLRIGRLARPRPRARGRSPATSSPCCRPAPTRMSMASNYNTPAARRRGDGRRAATRG